MLVKRLKTKTFIIISRIIMHINKYNVINFQENSNNNLIINTGAQCTFAKSNVFNNQEFIFSWCDANLVTSLEIQYSWMLFWFHAHFHFFYNDFLKNYFEHDRLIDFGKTLQNFFAIFILSPLHITFKLLL